MLPSATEVTPKSTHWILNPALAIGIAIALGVTLTIFGLTTYVANIDHQILRVNLEGAYIKIEEENNVIEQMQREYPLGSQVITNNGLKGMVIRTPKLSWNAKQTPANIISPIAQPESVTTSPIDAKMTVTLTILLDSGNVVDLPHSVLKRIEP